MTNRSRAMPGLVGYFSILIIFLSIIGPALV
jgi:hypothetical protein